MQYEVGLYVSGILRLIGSMPTGEFFFYDLLFMELFIPFLYFFGGLSMWIADWSVLPDTFMEDRLLHLFIHFFYFIISPRMQTSAFSLLCTVWHCVLLGIDWRRFFTGRLLHFLLYCIVYYCMLLTDADWRCLLPNLLVIVLFVLCGWVPLYWCSTCWFLTLKSAPPQPLNARVGVWHRSGWLIRGNRRTCRLTTGTVALKQLRRSWSWGKRSYKCAYLWSRVETSLNTRYAWAGKY